jgi:hypothetical protein
MKVPKKLEAKVSRVQKGCYKVKLPRQLPTKSVKALVVDAVPIPVAAFAEVLADGTLWKSSSNLRAWRFSRGVYQLEFTTQQLVKSVVVQVNRKPHSPRIFARIRPVPIHRAGLVDLRAVEIHLTNSSGAPADRSFAVMAITDGVERSQPTSKPAKKVK